MNILPAQISFFLRQHSVKRNLVALGRIFLMIFALIAFYSIIFHYIMLAEGQHYSWLTGVYWTLTVMSTLGFGDITFASETGKLFTIIVLCSGVLLLMVILPFTFIQFFYAPWLKAQEKGHTPRSIPADSSGQVIVVGSSPITLNLVDELENYGARCVVLCGDSGATLDLLDQGYTAVAGEHDARQTYVNLRLPSAAMLVTLESDVRNSNIIFTARDVSPSVSIVCSAQSEDAIDILRLAGATRVFQFHTMLGAALARRVLNAKTRFSVVSRYKELVIAEGPVMRTSLVGKSLKNSALRVVTGANVVGLWERGKFVLPMPSTVFTPTMVMVIAGDMHQIQAANAYLGKDAPPPETSSSVLIIGCGRVGREAALQLKRCGRQFSIVDKSPKSGFVKDFLIVGDAADREALKKAGIETAQSAIITTHDDDTNIYLTLYCRRLREDMQIISRATLDRNVGILHAAGADLVLSLASLVSSSIINLLSPGKVMMINEGLNIFRSVVGKSLEGKKLLGSGVRAQTHCSVVAVRSGDGAVITNPDPEYVFKAGDELYLIGDSASEKLYYDTFGKNMPLT
ncbi:MAG: NAD-binding protein [Desulfovibrio sp.]|nr:NAD-binding protein [Desulfovibrio sp.]